MHERSLRTVGVPRTYSIEHLSEETGFSRWSIRQYIKTGVLPAAHGRGPAAFYTDEHLRRLRAIRRELDSRRTASDWRERFAGVRA